MSGLERRYRVSCESYGVMRLAGLGNTRVRVGVETLDSPGAVMDRAVLLERLEAVLGSLGGVEYDAPLEYASAVSDTLRSLSVDVGVVQVEVTPGVWVSHLLVPVVEDGGS